MKNITTVTSHNYSSQESKKSISYAGRLFSVRREGYSFSLRDDMILIARNGRAIGNYKSSDGWHIGYIRQNLNDDLFVVEFNNTSRIKVSVIDTNLNITELSNNFVNMKWTKDTSFEFIGVNLYVQNQRFNGCWVINSIINLVDGTKETVMSPIDHVIRHGRIKMEGRNMEYVGNGIFEEK